MTKRTNRHREPAVREHVKVDFAGSQPHASEQASRRSGQESK